MAKRNVFYTILFFVMIPFDLWAQPDIKELNGKGEGYIVSQLGQYRTKKHSDADGNVLYYYDACVICMEEETSKIEEITIWDASVKVLSEYISGGIKIGDRASLLNNCNLAASKYGRNKMANSLSRLDEPFLIDDCPYAFNYVIFKEEYTVLYLSIHDNKIVGIATINKPDWPYPDYDPTITIW